MGQSNFQAFFSWGVGKDFSKTFPYKQSILKDASFPMMLLNMRVSVKSEFFYWEFRLSGWFLWWSLICRVVE